MILSRQEILYALEQWQHAWNAHRLDAVMALFHEDVVFEHWTGARVTGKAALRRAWTGWFVHHNGFRFTELETFVDEEQQKAAYRWLLEWPSCEGRRERREGVDVLHFCDGKIIRKLTYSKTVIEVEGEKVALLPRLIDTRAESAFRLVSGCRCL